MARAAAGRGAASSRARGMPSSRRQIAARVAASCSVTEVRRPGGRGPLEEQRDGGGGGHRRHLVVGRESPAGRAPPRARRAPAAAARLVASDDEVGAARDEVSQEWRSPGELLEVVEHQQDPQALEVRRRARRAGRRRRLGQAECGDDLRHHERRLAHRRQVDGAGATGELRRLAVQQLHREPGLADPAGPGDGDQPVGAGADEGAQPSRSASRPMSGVVGWAEPRRHRAPVPGERMARGRHPPRSRGIAARSGRRGPATPQRRPTRPVARHPGWGPRRPERNVRRRRGRGRRRGNGRCAGRAAALAALEGADRLGGQAGSLGQLLLGQRPRLAQAAQHDGEVARRRTWIHGSDASPSDAGRVGGSSGRAGVVRVWVCCGWGGTRRDAKVGRDGIRPPRREERP